MHIRLTLATLALAAAWPTCARADLIDAEIFSNHVEQIQQIDNDRQFRRTMNRGFDAMSAAGAGGASPEDAAASAAKQQATWTKALVLPASTSQRELTAFLAQVRGSESDRRALRTYMLSRFAAYPHEARQASFNPRNIADARLFALQTAYRAVRPGDPTGMPATLLLSIALSRQMTEAFQSHNYTLGQKQDALDYYVIVRALVAPAVDRIPEAGTIDLQTRRLLAGMARRLIIKDTAIDPATVSWNQLPCVGTSDIMCKLEMATARGALSR